jgi:hypothetical protein
MENTLIQQGHFTSDGTAHTLQLRGDVDWMKVWNITTLAAAGGGTACMFEWMRGLPTGYGLEYIKTAATNAIAPAIVATGGFTLVDTSTSPLGPINATVTAISNAAIPIVSATSTAGLVAGSIVRLVDPAGAQQFGGVDFEIDTVVANTSFRLVYAPQIVAGTTASFYPVLYPPQFYPRRRFISKLTAANPAVITTTVSHGLTAGQKFRINVPAVFGMTQINGLIATVVSVTAATITTDIDASAFTAFAWPLTADVPFTHATIVPVGEAAVVPYQNLLDDATINQGYIGMILAAGVDSPAGVNTNLIYWQAGKSFSVV